MPSVHAGGIEIDYETWGGSDDPPLILLRGLGTQHIQWPRRFCEQLAAAGLHLITPDNRDAGLSTHFHEAGLPDLSGIMASLGRGEAPKLAYGLADMAMDVVHLMDALGIETAHIAGISMGGMIVQQVAIDHPGRVRSLTSIMSSTGEPGLPGAEPEAARALTEPAPTERAAYIEHNVKTARAFTGSGFPFDEEAQRTMAGRTFDRAFDPPGIARQMAAVMASGSRREALGSVAAPTLVMHGAADPLLPVACGEATAAAIEGARLHVIEGMGHDLPEGAIDDWVREISAHIRRVEAAC